MPGVMNPMMQNPGMGMQQFQMPNPAMAGVNGMMNPMMGGFTGDGQFNGMPQNFNNGDFSAQRQ